MDKVQKKWGHKENQQIMLGLPNCDNKKLIRLLEFVETISQLSISLNDEMIYEINHQVTYDPRSYECNLCNCIYRSLKKSGLQQGLDRELVISVRHSNQLSYETTDVGSWSFMGPREPVRIECEVKIINISYIELQM